MLFLYSILYNIQTLEVVLFTHPIHTLAIFSRLIDLKQNTNAEKTQSKTQTSPFSLSLHCKPKDWFDRFEKHVIIKKLEEPPP